MKLTREQLELHGFHQLVPELTWYPAADPATRETCFGSLTYSDGQWQVSAATTAKDTLAQLADTVNAQRQHLQPKTDHLVFQGRLASGDEFICESNRISSLSGSTGTVQITGSTPCVAFGTTSREWGKCSRIEAVFRDAKTARAWGDRLRIVTDESGRITPPNSLMHELDRVTVSLVPMSKTESLHVHVAAIHDVLPPKTFERVQTAVLIAFGLARSLERLHIIAEDKRHIIDVYFSKSDVSRQPWTPLQPVTHQDHFPQAIRFGCRLIQSLIFAPPDEYEVVELHA